MSLALLPTDATQPDETLSNDRERVEALSRESQEVLAISGVSRMETVVRDGFPNIVHHQTNGALSEGLMPSPSAPPRILAPGSLTSGSTPPTTGYEPNSQGSSALITTARGIEEVASAIWRAVSSAWRQPNSERRRALQFVPMTAMMQSGWTIMDESYDSSRFRDGERIERLEAVVRHLLPQMKDYFDGHCHSMKTTQDEMISWVVKTEDNLNVAFQNVDGRIRRLENKSEPDEGQILWDRQNKTAEKKDTERKNKAIQELTKKVQEAAEERRKHAEEMSSLNNQMDQLRLTIRKEQRSARASEEWGSEQGEKVHRLENAVASLQEEVEELRSNKDGADFLSTMGDQEAPENVRSSSLKRDLPGAGGSESTTSRLGTWTRFGQSRAMNAAASLTERFPQRLYSPAREGRRVEEAAVTAVGLAAANEPTSQDWAGVGASNNGLGRQGAYVSVADARDSETPAGPSTGGGAVDNPLAPLLRQLQTGTWKNITSIPKLLWVEEDDAWKKSIALGNWSDCTIMALKGANYDIGAYFQQMMTAAQNCYERRRHDFLTAKREVPRPPPDLEQMDAKLMTLLINAIPERLKELCLREKATDCSATVLLTIVSHVMPGGEVEVDQLLAFSRKPTMSGTSAKASRLALEDWMEARKRLVSMGYSDLVPQEALTVLDLLIKPVLQRDDAAGQRYQQERYSTQSLRPTTAYVERLTNMVIEELRLMVQKESQGAGRIQLDDGGPTWARSAEVNAAAVGPSASFQQGRTGRQVVERSRPGAPNQSSNSAHEALVQADKDMKAQLLEFKKSRTGHCRYFMDRFCYKGNECKAMHDPKVREEYKELEQKLTNKVDALAAKVNINVVMAAKANAQEVQQEWKIPPYKRVLLDSGANELVRPYHEKLWNDIIGGRLQGEWLDVTLAGGIASKALKTDGGEIMFPPDDGGLFGSWIVPVMRMTDELGARVQWTSDGCTVKFPDGQKVDAYLRGGLTYLPWESFRMIRGQLMESHRNGRQRTVSRTAVSLMEVVDEDIINKVGKSKDEAWQQWIRKKSEKEVDDVVIANMKCSGDVYDKDCGLCKKSRGAKRRHKKKGMEDTVAKWSMSADLSGPHPTALNTSFKYLMVVVFTDDQRNHLPFVKGLETKSGEEVTKALREVMNEARAMYDVDKVSRFHSDKGGEFWNAIIHDFLREKNLYQTTTGGNDPQNNGLAERFVGIIKKRATSYLIHSKLSLDFWYWASLQAAMVYRLQKVSQQLPENTPTFGNVVLIRDPEAEKKSFHDSTREGIFLAWDHTVAEGAWVATFLLGAAKPTITRVAAPQVWPGSTMLRWKTKESPLSKEKVWVSTTGEIRFARPNPDEILTMEERNTPPPAEEQDVGDEVRRVGGRRDYDWVKFLTGPEVKEEPETLPNIPKLEDSHLVRVPKEEESIVDAAAKMKEEAKGESIVDAATTSKKEMRPKKWKSTVLKGNVGIGPPGLDDPPGVVPVIPLTTPKTATFIPHTIDLNEDDCNNDAIHVGFCQADSGSEETTQTDPDRVECFSDRWDSDWSRDEWKGWEYDGWAWGQKSWTYPSNWHQEPWGHQPTVAMMTTGKATSVMSKEEYIVGIPDDDVDPWNSKDEVMLEDQVAYEVESKFVEEKGVEAITSGMIQKMGEEDKKLWIEAMQKELDALKGRKVYETLSPHQVSEKYWSKNIKTKVMPGTLVTVKKSLHDGKQGWKAKARICVCGNFDKADHAGNLDNRSEVPATFELRTLLAMASKRGWSIGSLDVVTAFLYSEFDDSEDDIILVKPPAILVKFGLIEEGVYWKLNRVLYGLRSGPKRWGDTRDVALAAASILKTGGVTARWIQGEICKNVWKLVTNDGIIHGYMMVYVDDILLTGPDDWIRACFEAVQGQWDCKIDGILKESVPGGEVENDVDKIVNQITFLGMTIEKTPDGFLLHQLPYVCTKLADRGMLQGTGKAVLPQAKEGKLWPEDKTKKSFQSDLHHAQMEVGTLQWLAIKTRPDIAAACSVVASMMNSNPNDAIETCKGIWKYVAATWHYKIKVEASAIVLGKTSSPEWEMTIATDASHSPGGSKSRTGVVILLNGVPVHWTSTRQSMTALSSCESEVIAHVTGLKLGLAIRDMVEELDMSKCAITMTGDNMAAISTITNEVTSWRTRHYAQRASWIREMCRFEGIQVVHTAGKELISDPLTKTLDRHKLAEAREKLGMVPSVR